MSPLTSRQKVRNRAELACTYSIKILHELEEILKFYEYVDHKNTDYLHYAMQCGILYREVLSKLRDNL